TDHGEHFTEIGEHLPLVDIAPGGDAYFLIKGHDNHLYFDGGGEYWKSIRDADHIRGDFPLENTAWVQFYRSLYEDSTYYQLGIKGDTVVNEMAYKKVINCAHLGYPIEGECFGGIREDEDGKCYFMSFVHGMDAPWPLHYDCEVNTEYPLYDFSLSICDVFQTIGLSPHVVFDTAEMTLNGSPRKVLWFGTNCDNGNPYYWQWIEGIGCTHSLLYPIQWEPDNGPEYRLVEVWQDEELLYRNPHFDDYVPLVHEGNDRQKWNVVYIASMNYPNDYFTEIQSIRDNINLDGVDYKLVWTKSKYGTSKAGAVREEDKRIYYRRKISQNYQDEVLLYDFNLTVGDTVTVNWMHQQLMVLEESEVEVNGTMRRKLGLGRYYIGYPPTEVDEYWIEGVGSTYGFLNSGYEVMDGAFMYLLCYHENGNLIWDNVEFDDCVMNSDGAPASFAPQGAEWYFDVFNPWGMQHEYAKFSVEGDTVIQGHHCSIITQNFVETGPGHEYGEFVYEEDNKVYWFNPTTNAFTTLYDFDAEAGDSWYYEVDTCSHLVTVDSVGSVTWDGRTYRTQWVRFNEPLLTYRGKIIEGIGYEKGLFPSIWTCNGEVVYDASEIEYLRCYIEDGEMFYHEGSYDCDEIVVPSHPFTVGDLLYEIINTAPPHVSVIGHVDGENAQGELDIPSWVTYEGENYTVTEIGEWAFKNCTGLTGQLYFPSTIDTIREGAFYGCSGFTGTLDLSFSTVVFKENVFRDCTGFTNLILPLFISEIPQGLFCGCSGFTGTLVLPETVEIIGEYAFAKCSGYTGLVLPNGLREIREQAFSGCTGFTGNLVLPETVTHIKYGAFHDCSGFSGDLVLPNSVVEVGHTTNPIFNNMPLPDLYTSAFADCFDHLVLSQSLETIGMYCFAGCTRLTGDLVMPSGLKAIKDYAFAGCTGFNSLTLNDSLLLIGRDAFMACNGITGTLTIPENISLGLGAFEMCEGIEELDLPHNITFVDSENIKGGVFYRCTGLTEVDIPEGWIKIEQSTFAYCSNLRRVHLPESLISIEDGAFLECTNLEEINIPEGVTGIKDASFALCRSLTHIELPSTLRTLGSAFQRCTSLTGDMVIPDLVQKINAYTFDSCNMLNRIVLGDSVNWISEPAFDYTELSSLVLKTMSPPQLWRHESPNAWHLPVDIPIIVPCGALEAYQNDENWSGFTNITEDCGSGMTTFNGSEWYYEILNEDGSITYQHLQQSADTTVNDKTVTVIIRTNTLYDKGRHQEVTREYIYEEDNVVYWWNNELMEFTVLYDLGAQQGDSWVIKVGTETLSMYVDAVEQYYYDGRLFKMLVVSDEQDLFSGIIVCGIGHLTSFFPERLMTRGEKYRVEGIRCYWREGDLVFKYGDRDCDEVYEQYHFGIEEDGPSTGSGTFAVYPNPTDGTLFVQTLHATSLPTEYRIINMMGQTVLTGSLNAETQQIDVSNLPQGMYFITVEGETRKFVVR
ncbi:MAG: leucine-rich repeat domain-containing protein, partial [Prevotella sp.]|nr:leucine-rich repeat domain-containing protein [Prevotella sp.]